MSVAVCGCEGKGCGRMLHLGGFDRSVAHDFLQETMPLTVLFGIRDWLAGHWTLEKVRQLRAGRDRCWGHEGGKSGDSEAALKPILVVEAPNACTAE